MAGNSRSPGTCSLTSTSPVSAWRRNRLRILLAGFVVLLLAIVLGCMSLSFGERHYDGRDDGLLCQEDEFELRDGASRTVYYPIPYASPPNLVVASTFGHVEIEEQAADHFRVSCTDAVGQVTWKAKGLRVTPPPATIVVTPVVPAANTTKQ